MSQTVNTKQMDCNRSQSMSVEVIKEFSEDDFSFKMKLLR